MARKPKADTTATEAKPAPKVGTIREQLIREQAEAKAREVARLREERKRREEEARRQAEENAKREAEERERARLDTIEATKREEAEEKRRKAEAAKKREQNIAILENTYALRMAIAIAVEAYMNAVEAESAKYDYLSGEESALREFLDRLTSGTEFIKAELLNA